jgi:hypothetical protein
MDLSRLSDDDLRALSVNNLGAMSDAGLRIIAAGGQEAPKKKGIGAALGKGFESFLGAGQTTLESPFGANKAAERGLQRGEELGKKYEDQIGLDRLKQAYEQKGIVGAGGELARQVPLALAEQAPNIAASLGSARLGAMVGSPFGPVGAGIGALGGALLPSATQLFGSNVERQAAEQKQAGQPTDINVGKAAAATAIQAPLDVVATYIPLGGKIIGKMFGPEVEKLLMRGGTQAAEKLAQESFKKTLGKGLVTGAAAEIPTEIAQQVLERAQAGLPLTSADALKEYGETAYQAGLLAPIGGAGRFVDKSGARTQIEEKKQEDRRVAQQQAAVEQEQEDARLKEYYAGAEGQAEVAQRTAEYEQQVSDLRQVLKEKDLTKEDKQSAKQQLDDLFKGHNEYLQLAGVTAQAGEINAPLTIEQRLQALKDQRAQVADEARAGLTLGEEAPKASAINAPSTLTLRERETTELSQLEAQKNATTDPVKKRELEIAIARLKEQPSDSATLLRQTGLIEKQVDTVQNSLQEALKKNDFKAAKALSDQLEPLRLALDEAAKQRDALPKQKETNAQQIAAVDREIKKHQGDLQKYSGESFDKAKFDKALDALEKATAKREVLQEPPAPMEQQGLAFEPTKEEKAYEKRQAGLEKTFGETDKYLLDKVFDALGASAEDRGLPETPTEQALSPRNRIKRALNKQRIAHDNLADAVEDIRANPESPMRFTLVPSAKSRYLKGVIAEVDSIRDEAKQKPLTNTEKLKLAYDVRDALNNVVNNKNASVLNRISDTEPTQFEKQLAQVKAKYTKGASKFKKPEEFMLRKERDPAQMLRTEEAKAKPNMEVVKALTNEVKARKKEDDRIAAEKAKQEEIDMERYAPSGVSPDQKDLFAEKDLEPTAVVRATPQNFMRFVGIQSNKLKQSIAAAQRALEASKPKGKSAQQDRLEAEAKQAKTGPLVERLVNRLEDSFSETKNELKERSDKLRELFSVPLENKLLRDIADTNEKIESYERRIKLFEGLKTLKESRSQEAEFIKKSQIPAFKKRIAELKDTIAKAENYLTDIQKRDSELFTIEVENNKRSVQMTRKVLKNVLDENKITPEQNTRLSAKVDAAEAKAQADIEKRVVANRKAEQEALEKAAVETKIVPETKKVGELIFDKKKYTQIRKRIETGNRALKAAKTEDAKDAIAAKIKVDKEALSKLKEDVEKRVAKQERPLKPEEKREQLYAESREGAAEMRAIRTQLGLDKPNRKDVIADSKAYIKALQERIEVNEKKRRITSPRTKDRAKFDGILDVLNKELANEEITLKDQQELAKGERALAVAGNAPAKTNRLKPLRTGARKEKPLSPKEKAEEIESEFEEAAVSRADFDFVKNGLGFGFKARDEKTQGAGVSQADVKKELAKVKIPKGLDIIVIDKISGSLAELIQARGYDPKTIRGAVMANGKVLIVAGNHSDIKDLKATIAHELIGHVGVEGLLGEAGMKALAKRIQKDENSVFELAKKLGVFDDVLGAYSAARRYMSEEDAVAQAVRELIAHVEEASPNRSFLEKANAFIKAMVGALRASLRKMGLDLDISTSDIYKLLRDARANFKDMAPGAHVNKDGNIVFSGKPAVANVGFEDVLGYSDKIVAKEKSFVDKIKGEATGLIFKTKYIDRFAPIQAVANEMKDALKATQLMYFLRMHDQRMSFTSEVASNGPLNLKPAEDGKGMVIESTPGANLKDMAAALKDADVGNAEATSRIFTLYLAAKRAKKVGLAKLNFSEDITQKMLDDTIKAVEGSPATKAAFEKAAGIYAEYNKGLINFAVKTGAIPKDIGAQLTKDGDYVPFYRQRADGSVLLEIGGAPSIKIGNLADQPYLHELVGGDKPIFDVYTSALQNTAMLTDMALRNLATRNTAYALNEMGLLKEGGVRKGGDNVKGPAIIRFKRDGENYYAEVNTDAAGIPSELLVKGLEGVNTSLPNIVKLMNVPANLLRKWVTRNPAYALRQVVRDPLNAVMTTGLDTIPIVSSFKEISKMIRGKSEGEPLLQRRGILGGQVLTGTSEDMTKILRDVTAGKKGWEYRMAQLDQLAIQGDAATRVVMYNNFIKQGLSEMEATLATLESMNFSKRGISPSLFALSTMVPFMNAQIQGLNVIYQAFTGKMPFNEKLKVKQKLVQRALMMAGFTMLYASMMQDDEAYQNANDDEKYGNWFFPSPFGDEPIKVPIPFEMGLLFKAIPEAVINTAFGDEKARDTVSAIGKMAWNSIPISGPQGVKPLLEVAINHSFFTGREIESDRLQRFEPGERYTERTSEIAKLIGGTFNISPVKLEYLVRGYTGSLPLAVASLANPILRSSDAGEQPDTRGLLSSETPLIGSFFQAKDAGGLINKAYKDMNEIVQTKQTYEKMVEEGREKEADEYVTANADIIAMGTMAGSFRKKMGDLTKAERNVRADGSLNGAEKRAELDAIRQDKIALAKEFSSARE